MRTYLRRLKKDLPSRSTLDDALSLACELEVFRLVDGDERRSPLQVRSVDEADKEPGLLEAQLDMLRSDIRVHQQLHETQQVAMQQLVEQIQQFSKLLSSNTSGSQQRLPPSRYSNRNVQCCNCREFGHYRRNCPKYKSLDRANPGSGNAHRVSPTGQGNA